MQVHKKEKLREARRDIQEAMTKEGQVSTANPLPLKSISETNIMQQTLQAIILARVASLLETLLQGGSNKKRNPREEKKRKQREKNTPILCSR